VFDPADRVCVGLTERYGGWSEVKVYRIKDWQRHFENNRTKELKSLSWVPFPNKHDGDGYTELVEGHKDGPSHYGAWCALVQVASKCDPRGTLLRDGYRPHSPASLARKTRYPEKVLADAISRLIEIGWLEVMSDWPITCDDPAGECGNTAGKCDATAGKCLEGKGTEQKGTEGNGTEKEPSHGAAILAVFDHYRTYHPRSFLKPSSDSKEWKKIRERLLEGYTADDLKAAIDGNHRSAWHNGANDDGKQYHGLELIVRDGTHVNQFIEMPESQTVLTKKTQRTLNAGVSFLEKRMGTNEQNGLTEDG
jgi:hypothetical protein